MLYIYLLMSTLPMLAEAVTSQFHTSTKRGLIFIPNNDFPEDDQIWTREGSDLTWYYNYKMYPSPEYVNETSLEFVPMLWGAPSDVGDTTFLENVTAQILGGSKIDYVMAFNEPDNVGDYGGSNIPPADAAKYWKKQLEPLRKLGVALGAPAVTGGASGFVWLSNFTTACDGGCTFDFIPIHWYGSFDGLASHVAELLDMYPDTKIWVTEFALDNSDLDSTEQFFQTAVSYLDNNENITHYSYFGSFRSFKSNVGINVAMLNSYGNLTDIGGWYLDGNATGVKPDNITVTPTHTIPAASSTATYTVPALATVYSGAESLSLPWFAGPVLTFSMLLMVI